ncbi:MAG: hypothetical protein ABI091_22230 [Ferruginibacter sp.]
MTDLKKKVDALNKLIISGESIKAMEIFYSPDIEMQENEDTPRKGKSVCISTERDNLEKVKAVESNLLNQAINQHENVVFSEWKILVTYNDDSKYQLTNVSVQHWADGQISREKFYYKEFYKVD